MNRGRLREFLVFAGTLVVLAIVVRWLFGCTNTQPPPPQVDRGSVVVSNADGQVVFARGPAHFRNPATGRFMFIPKGATVSFEPRPD